MTPQKNLNDTYKNNAALLKIFETRATQTNEMSIKIYLQNKKKSCNLHNNRTSIFTVTLFVNDNLMYDCTTRTFCFMRHLKWK